MERYNFQNIEKKWRQNFLSKKFYKEKAKKNFIV